MQTLQAEATRRFAGQQPSSAGAGAAAANSPSAANPLAQRGVANPGQPAMPSQGNPFAGASAAMNGAMPMKGGTNLEKALIKRMNMYPPA